MYISFQLDSVAYDPKISSKWAQFLTREWNQNPKHLSRAQWLEEEYGIVLDRDHNDMLIGILIPDKLQTFIDLKSEF